MTIRNELRFLVLAIAVSAAWLLVPVTLFAAESAGPKQVSAQNAGALCEQYVREHHGHPGKGTDIVKVVYVDCSKKQ
ncbi:MAG TPA: hypothetical protein VJS12_14645 [Steroidobacteraceae bacterium]|nr:hypothetical protein [Steroidobacteraceae bacterium]